MTGYYVGLIVVVTIIILHRGLQLAAQENKRLRGIIRGILRKDKDEFVRQWAILEQRTREAGDRMGYKKSVEDGTYIALIHSEVTEALEALRMKPERKSKKIPEFSEVEEEFADIVIRVADRAETKGYRVGEAIMAKWNHNMNRKGDKKY